jgi:hypothetical protein
MCALILANKKLNKMNTNIFIILKKYIPVGILAVLLMGCERELEDLRPATFPANPEVFIDGFSAGLNYSAFGGSVPTAFDVDNQVTWNNSKSSMRFDVPNAGDPLGAYAGGVFSTVVSRDLSGFNALTFWAKASQSANLDLVGFGNDLGVSKYQVTISDLQLSTNWKKYIIPIPDPAKLTAERGMFFTRWDLIDGKGYSFWIDELKFEDLGTIAHRQPMIFDGNDKVESAVNGLKFPVVGLGVSFNLPTGINQTVIAAPAWFTFLSSNEGVASVDETGLVSVVSEGTAVITATSGGDDAKGSLTVKSSGEFIHAPDPTAAQEDVISIFSNKYENVPVDFFNGYWQPYQTTTSADFKVGDDNVLFYTNFNFVGIQFTSPTINASEMTHLHMDIWIPNEVNSADKIAVKLVDMGPDGALDGNDPTLVYEISGPLASQSWISVDISLSGLPSRSKLAQIILERLGSSLSGFYLDNVYFYDNGQGPANEPTEAAPTPPSRDAANVISLFGDKYENLAGTDFPNWGQATVVSDVQIAGNNTLKFAGLNYQGIQLASSQNVTGMEFLHIDFWTANSSGFNIFLISSGPVEKSYSLTVPTSGWASVDIPLTAFSPVNLADIIQLKFDGNGDIFIDNLYFYTTGGGTANIPLTAAPVPPARESDAVISLFSNAYTNKSVSTWSADWDDSNVEDIQIAGDPVKKYTFTNFAGIDFSSNKFDASGMTHFHIDIWTPDDVMSKSFTIKNVDFGGGTGEASSHILTLVHTASGDIPALEKGAWISVDVPISAFSGNLSRADLAQIVISSNLKTVYVDNIYFYKSGGGTAKEPTAAAPTPTHPAANVISLFSSAYTNVKVDTWKTDWSAASYEETTVAGKPSKKYSALNYVGIETGSAPINATDMTHLHLDVWSPDLTNFGIKLVDFGANGVYGGGDDVEHQIDFSSPAKGQWVSYAIPLSNFTNLKTRGHLAQYILVGQPSGASTIWIDNFYFYKNGGSSASGPTAAAPTPPARSAANVVSIYSDAYTPITINNFDAGWCGGAAATQVTVAGNNTLKKNAGIACHGIDFSTNRQNLSSFTHIHFDFYTDDTDLTGDVFNVKLVDFAGGNGEASALEVNINTGTTPAIVAGKWISVDINITALGGVVTGNLTRGDVAQIGITTANLTNVWYDNIYLYK